MPVTQTTLKIHEVVEILQTPSEKVYLSIIELVSLKCNLSLH